MPGTKHTSRNSNHANKSFLDRLPKEDDSNLETIGKMVRLAVDGFNALSQGTFNAATSQQLRPGEVLDYTFAKLITLQFGHAAIGLAYQIKFASDKSGLTEQMTKTCNNVASFFANIGEKVSSETIKGLKDLTKTCKAYGDKFMDAVGNVCQGFAAIAENVGKKMDNTVKIIQSNLEYITERAIGKTKEAGQGR